MSHIYYSSGLLSRVNLERLFQFCWLRNTDSGELVLAGNWLQAKNYDGVEVVQQEHYVSWVVNDQEKQALFSPRNVGLTRII